MFVCKHNQFKAIMSSSGVGRGRGWLNLNKNVASISLRPGTIPSPTGIEPLSPNAGNTDDSQFVDAANDFTDLISKVKQLNVNDDGIKFNQKIKYVLENWKDNCQTTEDVEHSFDVLYQACLSDADLASKLVIMIASRSFISQEVHDQNIRLMFLRKLQNNFEGSSLLQKTNPDAFRNSVQMLGEFYNKARLANGQQLTFMATPFISYLEMLLESRQPQDIELFTTQLYLNGSSIKTESPEKVIEILNKVRLTLALEEKLTKKCKLWLLLALDMASNRFGLLPGDIQKFYEDQLGDSAIASFQGIHGTLSVQTTHNSKTLDSYQSNVNVLQVSISSESTNDQISSPPYNSQSDFSITSQSISSSGFQSDSSSKTSGVSRNRDSSNKLGKPGRPILGSGARLNKNKSNDDSSARESQWRDREHSSGWGNKQKITGNWGDAKKTSKVGKGWEHDDRFETDYS